MCPEKAYDDSFGTELLYWPQHTQSTTRFLEKILICKTMHNLEEGDFNNLGFPSTTRYIYLTRQTFSLVRQQKKEEKNFHTFPLVIIYWISTTTFSFFFLDEKNKGLYESPLSKCYWVLLLWKELFQQPIQLQSLFSFLLSQPLQISRPRCSRIPCTHQR